MAVVTIFHTRCIFIHSYIIFCALHLTIFLCFYISFRVVCGILLAFITPIVFSSQNCLFLNFRHKTVRSPNCCAAENWLKIVSAITTPFFLPDVFVSLTRLLKDFHEFLPFRHLDESSLVLLNFFLLSPSPLLFPLLFSLFFFFFLITSILDQRNFNLKAFLINRVSITSRAPPTCSKSLHAHVVAIFEGGGSLLLSPTPAVIYARHS